MFEYFRKYNINTEKYYKQRGFVMERKKIAVVTGASSGLGNEFVKIFIKNRNLDEVWAIARNKDNLIKLKEEYGNNIKLFSVDLSDFSSVKKLGEIIRKKKPEIRYLVNSAGFAKFCSYSDLSLEESVNMINLNVSGVVAMGLICIPFMRRGGHILNIASQASFQPLPYQNIYSSTKAFVRSYSRALNVELEDRGITVTAVCPGWMDTGLYKRAEIGAVMAANNFMGMVSPDKVAEKAVKDALKGRDMSVYGPYVKACHLAAKILPQKVMMNLWLIQQGLIRS